MKIYFVSSRRNYSYKDGNNQILFGEQKSRVLKMWLVTKMEQEGKCFISNKRQVGRVEKKRGERERKEDARA